MQQGQRNKQAKTAREKLDMLTDLFCSNNINGNELFKKTCDILTELEMSIFY